jgi:hypothetical protein
MKKTWFITGSMDGVLFARASRTDIRVIRKDESFLGVPFAELEVGQSVEEKTPGEELARKLADNPRFKRAGESGIAYIIAGYSEFRMGSHLHRAQH